MALSKKALMRAVNSVPEGDDVGVWVVGVCRAVESEVRKQDDELILQLVEALEHTHRCIPMGGFAQIHWGSSTFEQIVQAAEAGRARLEGKPCA